MGDGGYRRITAADVLQWQRHETPVVRVRTRLDAGPGGLALAMLPMFVNWPRSTTRFGPDDHYIVRNVNISSNPVSGVTVLGSLKVLADSVASAEFVMVMSKVRGVETPGGHALLRFIFREDRRPLLLDQDGEPYANDPSVEDIVISWEAWRPPAASWDPVSSLDPETYALTPRCLVGSVRCLNDAVLDRPWHCYPLLMPDAEHALDELMYVSFSLADAVARQTVTTILDHHIEEGRNLPDDYPAADLQEWAQLADLYKKSEIPENPLQDILDGKIRYHLLERSCITMALSSVDWAVRRIHDRAGLGEAPRVRVAPGRMPPFMAELATGQRTKSLLRVPAALHWLLTNQTVIPGKAHELLDEVGLLQRRNGKVLKRHYDNRERSPYGKIAENVIF